MNRLLRSTTAVAAILGIVAPTVLQAEVPLRLAQADAQPVVVLPPGGDDLVTEAAESAAKAAAKAGTAASKAKAAADEALAEVASPVVVPPKAATATAAGDDDGKAPVVVPPAKAASKPAPKADEEDDKAPAKAAPKAAAKPAPADAPQDGNAPVVVAPAKEKPKAAAAEANDGTAKPAAAAKAKAEKPVAPAPGKDAPADDSGDALADAPAAERAREAAPVVVPPKAAAPAEKPAVAASPKAKARDNAAEADTTAKPAVVAPTGEAPSADALAEELAKKEAGKTPVVATPDAKATSGSTPVVAAPDAKPTAVQPSAANDAEAALAEALAKKNGAAPVVVPPASSVGAATGQKEAPKPVVVDAADSAALAEALGKAQAVAPVAAAGAAATATGAAAGNAPVVVPPGSDPAAARAAAGSPVVADALSAPASLGKDATSVLVTDGSARSSSEDFATSVAAAAAAAAAAGKGPVDNVAGTADPSDSRDKDNKEMLAKLLVAGLGAYAVGKMIQNQGQVALNTGDRVVVQAPDGSQQIWRDDNALLLQPGAQVTTENFTDGSSRSIVTRADGSRVVTIRDAQLRVLRRTLISANGTATELINDAVASEPVQVKSLPPAARPVNYSAQSREADLRAALEKEAAIDRRFSLGQVRNISEVRSLVAPISIDSITFDTGSAAIRPDQASQLSSLGKTIADMVKANPGEVFLVEGYTDTVGQPATNLALSDRRAESLALALSEYFQVPPENLVVQGYGERFLKVQAEGDVRENRRVAVRRITNLLQN